MEVATTRHAICQILGGVFEVIKADGAISVDVFVFWLEYASKVRRPLAQKIFMDSENRFGSTDFEADDVASKSGKCQSVDQTVQ